MNYWLMKSEPDAYSIEDLKKEKITHWDGIRNYQVRNMIRDDMRKGDLAFFYHSNCKEPGIVGTMTIHSTAYPDFTAFSATNKYYDPKSTKDNPRWFMVDVKYKRMLKRNISLQELKKDKNLTDLLLLKRGNRLSITKLTKKQWEYILQLE